MPPADQTQHSSDHAHGHSHSLREIGADVQVPRAMRYATFVLLVVVAAATAIGLTVLWPDYAKVAEVSERASFGVPGTEQVRGEVLGIEADCENGPAQGLTPEQLAEFTGERPDSAQNTCQTLNVGLRSGEDAGRLVSVTVRGTLAMSGIRVGDTVELTSFPLVSDGASGEQLRSYQLSSSYEVSGIVRHVPLIVLTLVFVVVVVAVGRLRGLFALLALVVAAGVLLGFVLPALVAGGPALLIALVGSSAIMFVTLYFVHGANMRTTSALIGTLAGVLIISGVSWVSVRVTRLSGLGDEASGMLSGMVSEIDFRGLLTCSILIAGLGVLNDVTITQASAVWELRAAAPEMTRRELYARGMRIGRDHIASTVYTVFFAYAGAAISVLIVLYLYNRPVLSLLTQEDIAIEIVRTLAGSIGLVLSVPITTWVAAAFVPPAKEELTSRWRDPRP